MQSLANPTRVRNSALWAAYGDALGFITEGTNENGRDRRLRGRSLDTMPWTRRINRFGPEIQLPAGAYSDDTQLRLATCRSIRNDRSFNVEAFAAAELPTWRQYALGAGLGSLSAARRLASGTRWEELVRQDRDGRYVNGGGNGAAMRIQPHIWASSHDNFDFLRDVIRNTACTHGHPKAFVGALYHGTILKFVMDKERMADVGEALDIAVDVRSFFGLFESIEELGLRWITDWQRATVKSFGDEWLLACDEITRALKLASTYLQRSERIKAYSNLLSELGLLSDNERGSATKTASASVAAIFFFDQLPSRLILENIANAVGSDTDSIGTMSGAILGGFRTDEFASALQDREYIEAEAARMAAISASSPGVKDFDYGRTRNAITGRGLVVGSIGVGRSLSGPLISPNSREVYQWCELPFGQTILLRLPSKIEPPKVDSPRLFDIGDNREVVRGALSQKVSAEESDTSDPRSIATRLRDQQFDPAQIGRSIVDCAKQPYGESLAGAIAFEVVRLMRQTETTKRRITQAEPSSAQREPIVALQLQLLSKSAKRGSTLIGHISNYGKATASEIVVSIADGKHAATFSFPELHVQDSRELNESIPFTVNGKTSVRVTYRLRDGAVRRQEGHFEPAAGKARTFLLKGLGLVQQG